jgi:hypothetical protein
MSKKDLSLQNVGTALAFPFALGVPQMAERLGVGELATGPKMPKLPEPLAMPLPDEEQVRLARRRSLVQQVTRRGRASTILSRPELMG